MTEYVLVPKEPTPDMQATMDELLRSLVADDHERGMYAFLALKSYRAMVLAAPPISDADLERAARALYEYRAKSLESRDLPWSTWDEVCELPGWKAVQIASMRAALSALTGDA